MSQRGLRAYIEGKRAAMRDAAARKPRGSDWRETVEATCVADDATGVRKLRIRDWVYLSDSGPDFGGWGLGPSSPELLCGVISTCLTHTYLIAAAALGLALDRVEVRVAADNNDARFVGVETDDPPVPFNMRAQVSVEAPEAGEDAVGRLHDYVEERCPLTRLIKEPGSLTIDREV